jgi:hypothetical protein
MGPSAPHGGWKGNPKHRIFFDNHDIRDSATCEFFNGEIWEFSDFQMQTARRSASSAIVKRKLVFKDSSKTVEFFYIIGGEKSCKGCIWPGKSKALLSSVEILSSGKENWKSGPELPGIINL